MVWHFLSWYAYHTVLFFSCSKCLCHSMVSSEVPGDSDVPRAVSPGRAWLLLVFIGCIWVQYSQCWWRLHVECLPQLSPFLLFVGHDNLVVSAKKVNLTSANWFTFVHGEKQYLRSRPCKNQWPKSHFQRPEQVEKRPMGSEMVEIHVNNSRT